MALRLTLVTISYLVLAAHFFRSGGLLAVALCGILLFIAFVREPWARHVTRIALVLGAAEWVRTAVTLAAARIAMAHSATRLLVILIGVALFTLASALLLRGPRVREFYSSDGDERSGPAASTGSGAGDV